MTTTHPIPATRNEAWGFWGTMNEHASAAWPLAMSAFFAATGQPLEAVRSFLDSRFGRHFADEVQNSLYEGQTLVDAIDAATRQWMGWKIGRQTRKEYCIPHGLPYLTGLVIHCAITDEVFAA